VPTEREYKEWQTKLRKSRRNRNSNHAIFWLFGLVLLSVLLSWKNNQQIYQERRGSDSLNRNIENTNPTVNRSYQNIVVGSINLINNINYAQIDNQAFSIHYQGDSVSELAKLLSQFASTEAEKARIIYSWIAYNITYDVPAFLSGNYGDTSPKGILKTRKSICSGYANLYKAVAKAMGLDALVIDGYAKGVSYTINNTNEINHAWNAVKINNGWYLVDATWGAGNVNGGQFSQKFNSYYFATPPEQFIYDHFPSEKTWQFLTQPLTKKQFDLLPEVSSQFFKDGLRFVSHNTHTITASGRVDIILEADEDTIITSELKQGGTSLEKTYTFEQKQNGKIFISVAFPLSGTYDLNIFSKKRHEAGAYSHAVSYKIIANTTGEEFPLTYSNFIESAAYLYTPLNKYLASNQSYYFKVNIPNATDVQIIEPSSNNWTQLTRSGSVFEGNVDIGLGKILLAAKFSEDEKYWTLVEYN
jgi:transglutaminase/protease-like cytokinesis protein 3